MELANLEIRFGMEFFGSLFPIIPDTSGKEVHRVTVPRAEALGKPARRNGGKDHGAFGGFYKCFTSPREKIA